MVHCGPAAWPPLAMVTQLAKETTRFGAQDARAEDFMPKSAVSRMNSLTRSLGQGVAHAITRDSVVSAFDSAVAGSEALHESGLAAQ